jgi:hypothetical protein
MAPFTGLPESTSATATYEIDALCQPDLETIADLGDLDPPLTAMAHQPPAAACLAPFGGLELLYQGSSFQLATKVAPAPAAKAVR